MIHEYPKKDFINEMKVNNKSEDYFILHAWLKQGLLTRYAAFSLQ